MKPNKIPVVLSLPEFLQHEDPQVSEQFTALFETGIVEIEGLDELYEREDTGDNNDLVLTFSGQPPLLKPSLIQTLLHLWITKGVMDPTTGVIAGGAFSSIADVPTTWYGLTLLLLEPDVTYTSVIGYSWQCSSMLPITTGSLNEMNQLKVPFKSCNGLKYFDKQEAQAVLNALNLKAEKLLTQ